MVPLEWDEGWQAAYGTCHLPVAKCQKTYKYHADSGRMAEISIRAVRVSYRKTDYCNLLPLLTKVDPKTVTGRMYRLTKREIQLAIEKLSMI